VIFRLPQTNLFIMLLIRIVKFSGIFKKHPKS
jgi:hypothetical protein